MFWAANSVPLGFEAVSKTIGIRTIPEMDATTQGDMTVLANTSVLPCAEEQAMTDKIDPSYPPVVGRTTKCEAAVGTL